MHPLDALVLAGYFIVLIAIGVYFARRIRAQEDFFMGGRGFGKLLQTFAAFGAGTGSADPVNTGRTTITSGLSGMWSVMYWLFVTPFYWITGVWYRRMRHLTLGDWFVERYESRALGAAYALCGLAFMIVYGGMMFSALGKVAAPILDQTHFVIMGEPYKVENVLVPIIGIVVLVYGIAGGLSAAYFTDLIQGLCIIFLSIMLIPFGLEALVEKFGQGDEGMLFGFKIIHERLPENYFHLVGSSSTSEFPLHRLVAVVLLNLVGIVVQPHFIATGGGSAKNEMSARVGLVVGNFLKRFCTVGWVLTALIALALFADHPEIAADPDKTWGVTSRELLGPGLTGLMLACLLAALMSSVDAYMVVGSALVVRNIYAPYINPNASEAQYVRVARITGVLIVAGGVWTSLALMDVFKQLQISWIVPAVFGATFWVGMYWRRATRAAAWTTVIYCVLFFFLLPLFLPVILPGLKDDPQYAVTNRIVVTTTTREATPSDASSRDGQIKLWEERRAQIDDETSESAREQLLASLGPRPQPLAPGDAMTLRSTGGGKAIFWSEGVVPVDAEGNPLKGVKPRPIGEPQQIDANTTEVTLAYDEGVRLRGQGNFNLDFLLYKWVGVDLPSMTNATLNTLELPPKIIAPFLIMILVSLVTRRGSKQALDRYYAKMKTPVDPDPERDREKLEAAYANPEELEKLKLFPGTSLEFQKPSLLDAGGFILCVAACFGIIWLALFVASVGS